MIVNGKEFEVAPVLELSTETLALPATTRSALEIEARSVVELTTVVVRLDPFHSTTGRWLK